MSFDSDETESRHADNLDVASKCERDVRHPENESNEMRESIVHEKLIRLKNRQSTCQFEIAGLLREVQEHALWKSKYRSFKEYVELVVDMKLRTVQEMLRVIRACEENGIGAETIQQFGWSKVAVLASNIKPKNVEQCMSDLRSLSFSQLREKYKAAKSGHRNTQLKPDRNGDLIITQCILDAMRHAALETNSIDGQVNLEFVASRFIALSTVQKQIALIAIAN